MKKTSFAVLIVILTLLSACSAPSYRYLAVSTNYDEYFQYDARTIVLRDSNQTEQEVVKGYDPSLFPDGRLAYTAPSDPETDQGNGDIWVLDMKSGKINLTKTRMVNEFRPAVSPDGQYIAYLNGNSGSGLCIMKSDGSDNWCIDSMSWIYTINCSEYGQPPSAYCSEQFNVMSYSWSPIVKDETYDLVFESNWNGEGNKLYHMVLVKGALAYINLIADKAVSQAISPDGTLIFSSYSTNTIDQINLDGSGRKVFISQEARDFAWSHDGKKIAYGGYTPDGNRVIYIANSDGSGAKNVALGYSPVWSLDGSFILFEKIIRSEAEVYGHNNVYKYDVLSGQETLIHENTNLFFDDQIIFLK